MRLARFPLPAAALIAFVLATANSASAQPCQLGWGRMPRPQTADTLSSPPTHAAIFDAGDGPALYVGGPRFPYERPTKPPVPYLARWKDGTWEPVGAALEQVTALAVLSDGLYSGTATGIRRLSSGAWSDVATTNGAVDVVIEWNGDLIIGGRFTVVNGVSTGRMARRQGGIWSPLSANLPSNPQSLAVYNGDLYASAGDRVYRWGGAAWQPLSATWPQDAGKLIVYSGVLVMSGDADTDANTLTLRAWNGAAFSSLVAGVQISGGSINTIAIHDGKLVLAGTFQKINNLDAYGIAAWDGQDWTTYERGVYLKTSREPFVGVQALAASGTHLYVVGSDLSQRVSDEQCSYGFSFGSPVAQWNGSTWIGLSRNIIDEPLAFDTSGDRLLIAADTARAGGVISPAAMYWDGADLAPMGGGVWFSNWQCNYNIPLSRCALSGPDGDYIGGFFDFAGDQPARSVARWDGVSWDSLGGGVDGIVNAMIWWDNKLVVGGHILEAGGLPVSNIAAWDGFTWSTFDEGFFGEVYSLTVHDGQLIAGGHLIDYGSAAVWNGRSWTRMGYLFGTVRAFAHYNGDLYAGGDIGVSGDPSIKGVARWVPGQPGHWAPLGSGVDPPAVRALASYRGELYVGGQFTSAGGVPATAIARFDGQNWHALDGTFAQRPGWGPLLVSALAVFDNDLIVGGNFSKIGPLWRYNIARWGCYPPIPPPCKGDMNCDGRVDFADIDLFVHVFGLPSSALPYWEYDCHWQNADCNGDTEVNLADVDPFIERLGMPCP